jgi:hypothetical protein
MTRKIRIIIVSAITITGLLATQTFYAYAAAVPEPAVSAGSVIINEVKSGNGSGAGTTTPAEYVTVYNTTDAEVVLDGWKLEFAKQTFPAASCATSDWKAASAANSNALPLAGTLAPHSVSQPFPLAINNDTAGAVQLVDGATGKQDLVGWDMGATAAPCAEAAPAPALHSGKSLQRYLGCISNLPIDTDDNGADLAVSSNPSPGLAATIVAPQCTPAPDPDEPDEPEPLPGEESEPDPDGSTGSDTPEVPAPTSACEGVIISEVLPNPAGTDSGHEFIELHNPTSEHIALDACRLQTSASTTAFHTFSQAELEPGEYRALPDNETRLSLPNASGGTVWLLAADNSEVAEVMYPGDLPDNVGWAKADGIWGQTYTLTPNASNAITPTAPCPAGQVRNIETNRCNNISSEELVSGGSVTTAGAAAGGLAPCKAGQERNPETNRCRNIASGASAASGNGAPAPCKAGQERNPDTNRCRNIATAGSTKTAAPCPAGQERNPDTNRCRKITAGSTAKHSGNVEDASTTVPEKKKPYALIAAVILAVAICYAVYEWRQEIVGFIKRYLPAKKPLLPYTRVRA